MIRISDKTYDTLKWVAQFFLPGLGTMYFALANIWGLPSPEKVVGTIVALDAFLGALLGLSMLQYQATQKMNARIGQYTQTAFATETETKTSGISSNPFAVQMTSDVYDVLSWVAQIALPALGTLYFALASLWGFPYGQEVVGTIAALDAFLGLMLGMSTAQFKMAVANKGQTAYLE
jgi:imidazoleglycerol phosphate synthase glutamine amidotransferase subunit HisH